MGSRWKHREALLHQRHDFEYTFTLRNLSLVQKQEQHSDCTQPITYLESSMPIPQEQTDESLHWHEKQSSSAQQDQLWDLPLSYAVALTNSLPYDSTMLQMVQDTPESGYQSSYNLPVGRQHLIVGQGHKLDADADSCSLILMFTQDWEAVHDLTTGGQPPDTSLWNTGSSHCDLGFSCGPPSTQSTQPMPFDSPMFLNPDDQDRSFCSAVTEGLNSRQKVAIPRLSNRFGPKPDGRRRPRPVGVRRRLRKGNLGRIVSQGTHEKRVVTEAQRAQLSASSHNAKRCKVSRVNGAVFEDGRGNEVTSIEVPSIQKAAEFCKCHVDTLHKALRNKRTSRIKYEWIVEALGERKT
jgi:hypothetical protein